MSTEGHFTLTALTALTASDMATKKQKHTSLSSLIGQIFCSALHGAFTT
jgi:hypothetical protein